MPTALIDMPPARVYPPYDADGARSLRKAPQQFRMDTRSTFGEMKMEENMTDELDDAPYQKRQRTELFVQWLYGLLSLAVLVFTMVQDPPPTVAVSALTASLVLGGTSLMYGLSRRHRQAHKQLHNMLADLRDRHDNTAEPPAAAAAGSGK